MRTHEWLRLLKLDRLLGLLPGVAKDPQHPSRYVVREVGKQVPWFLVPASGGPQRVLQVFGYRRVRTRDGKLTLERLE